MKITEYEGRKYFTGWAGLDLFFDEMPAKGPEKASVILLHGYSEYAERYAKVAAKLAGDGYSVYYYDQRGHGRSEGIRADVVRFNDYVRDLSTFSDYVRERSAGKKLFVVAHSTGAAAAVLYAAKISDAIDGLVTTGIYIHDAQGYEPWKAKLGKILIHFAPLLQIQELDPARVAENPDVQRAYKSDPLIYHGAARVRMGMHFIRMESYLSEAMQSLSVPLLVVHGANDRLASVDGSRALYKAAASPDKHIDIIEGVGHEVLHDFGWEERCRELAAWLGKRL